MKGQIHETCVEGKHDCHIQRAECQIRSESRRISEPDDLVASSFPLAVGCVHVTGQIVEDETCVECQNDCQNHGFHMSAECQIHTTLMYRRWISSERSNTT